MSKIICDVCGTSYPDTATQCPICGCVSSADVEAVVTTQETAETVTAGTYTYVKGGRFSKSNVKKRNQGKPVATAAASAPAQTKTAVTQKKSSVKPDQKTNLGLIIIIVVLLLAIVSVLSYIAIRFVVPGIFGDNGDTGVSEYVPVDDGEDDTEPTESVDPDVPCTGIVLEEVETTFSAAGETYMLTVTPEPLETTDEVLFASEDETVATVDESGLITAVAEGSTVITVTCGTQTELFSVVCQFATDNDFVLDAESYTLTKKGDTWTCYTGTIPVEDITWTSDDETIATVDKGVVTAVGTGVSTMRRKPPVKLVVRIPAVPEPVMQPTVIRHPQIPKVPTTMHSIHMTRMK